MKFGINLYGVLKGRKDTFAALEEVKAMGYTSVEPCVAPGVIDGWDHVIWPASFLIEKVAKIREMGLEVTSVHLIGWNAAVQREQIRDMASSCSLRYVVVKSPEQFREEAIQQAAMEYMCLADTLQEVGTEVLLHNEERDVGAFHAQSSYEILLELCLGKVYAQVDVGWILAALQEPQSLLWKLGSRVRSLHYKDFAIPEEEGGDPIPTAIGGGDLDVAACFQFARAMGIPQYVDLDGDGEDPALDQKSSLEVLRGLSQERSDSISFLNTLDVETGEVKTLKCFEGVIEAPNWLKGEGRMIYNSEGQLYSYDIETRKAVRLDTGSCGFCNNDHVVSPDEKELAFSCKAEKGIGGSRIYVMSISGGEARLVTKKEPSYLHGWFPDGRELAYCAFREHGGEVRGDIYTIPYEGGEEMRLTDAGFNDGPEYSPDGNYIWFNSTRSGLMQIWRMKRDGSEQTQMTANEANNWFAHVSPDGSKVVYLAYGKDDLEPTEHLPNMPVELWMMNADGTNQHKLLSFLGGQGSINVNSWSGDSRQIAFVSYEIVHKASLPAY